MKIPYHLFADFVVVIHLIFVLFSFLGALLAIWWRKIFYLHLPAAVWAAWIEFSGRICPLTPLENWLRLKGGGVGYGGDFVGHYLLSVLYPAGLTRNVQFVLGGVVVGLNLMIYGYILFARKRRGGQS